MARKITLEPVIEREWLKFQPVRVESSIAAGFRVGWMDFENDEGLKFDVSCGAGVGSPWMILSVDHPDVGHIEEVVDIRAIVNEWVRAAIAAGPTPKIEE